MKTRSQSVRAVWIALHESPGRGGARRYILLSYDRLGPRDPGNTLTRFFATPSLDWAARSATPAGSKANVTGADPWFGALSSAWFAQRTYGDLPDGRCMKTRGMINFGCLDLDRRSPVPGSYAFKSGAIRRSATAYFLKDRRVVFERQR